MLFINWGNSKYFHEKNPDIGWMCPISYCIGKYSSICLGSMYTSITYLKSNTVSSGSSPYKLKLDIWLVFGSFGSSQSSSQLVSSCLKCVLSSFRLVSPILKMIWARLARDSKIFVSFHLYNTYVRNMYVYCQLILLRWDLSYSGLLNA